MEQRLHSIMVSCIKIIGETPGGEKGVPVKYLHNKLIQNKSFGNKLSYAELFNALCCSVESTHFFVLINADDNDMYFTLKNDPEVLLAEAESIEILQPFDTSQYEIDFTPVEIPNFDTLMQEMDVITRQHQVLLNKNEELNKMQNDLQTQILSLDNPTVMKQTIYYSTELLKKLGG